MGEEAFLRQAMKEAPAWVKFPDVERVEWVNQITAIFWPHIGKLVERILR